MTLVARMKLDVSLLADILLIHGTLRLGGGGRGKAL